MINGLPIKLIRESEAGNELETAYFASFRKYPELSKLCKAMVMAESTVRRSEKLVQLATRSLENASDVDEAEKAADALDVASDSYYDAQDALMAAADAFLVAGFVGAGYDQENAARLAAAVPQSRLPEVVARARIGSGVMDFSMA
jgi:hypothetical protein